MADYIHVYSLNAIGSGIPTPFTAMDGAKIPDPVADYIVNRADIPDLSSELKFMTAAGYLQWSELKFLSLA